MIKYGKTFLSCRIYLLLISIVWNAVACIRGQDQIRTLEATFPPAKTTSAGPTKTVNIPLPSSSPALTPTTRPRLSLTICQSDEPTTLYLYDDTSQATRNLWGAIYDGPIDHSNYNYQPVILQKLPSFQDGDALVEDILVKEGDLIVDKDGHPVELSPGTKVYLLDRETMLPNVVTYQGGSIRMQTISAEFKIKEGVTWSDGEPVKAEDSVFSFQMAQLRDQKRQATEGSPMGWENPDLSEKTASYQALNERTVKWTGLPGYFDTTYFLNFYPPLPSHQLDQYPPQLLPLTEQASLYPLGWGPFRIVSWEPGKEIRLERNPYYFRSNEGLPLVDEVTFLFIPQHEQLQALLDDRCQIGTQHGTFPFIANLNQYLELEKSGLLNVEQTPDRIVFLVFGIDKTNGQRSYFEDHRVREAVAFGINRQALASALPQAMVSQPDSYLPPGHPYFDQGVVDHYVYDPARASELLEEAGWVDKDMDGVLDKASVEFIVKTVVREGDSEAMHVLQLVQQDLEKIGIKLEITSVAGEEYFAKKPESPRYGRNMDLLLLSVMFSTQPDCQVFSSAAIPGSGNDWGGTNLGGYNNPEFSAACWAGLSSLDAEGARDFHLKAKNIFSQDLPAISLYITPKFAIARPEINGFLVDPSELGELWMIEGVR